MYGTEEISGEIRSIQITSGACSEGNFTVGAVFSSHIEVVIDECEDILEDKELLLQIGLLLDDGTTEYADIGYYTVTNPKTSAYSTTFTAVGRITSKLNKLFDVPKVLTLRNIANAITAATGANIVFNGEVSDAVLAKDIKGMTCKEALSVIAGTFGGFATEGNSGNIVVSKYNTASKVSVDGDRMTTLPEFNDYAYELNGIKVIVSAEGQDEDGNTIEEVAFTEGTPRITVNNEFMTAGLFESFAVNTIGYTYRPGTVPLALGDPRLQPWDCLEVTDVKGNVHIVPCLNIVHTFDGGLTTTITAPGESETESSSSVAGPITQQLERLNYELFTAKEAIVNRLKADELEAEVAKLGYASIKELEAVNATIGDLKAKDAEITGKLTANDAAIENLKAKDTEITGLLTAANAEITNLKAKDAEITGTLTAATADITDLKAKDVEIESTLTAATADITNLKAKDAEIEGTLKATNAEITNLKAKDVEITGQLTAVSASIGELEAKAITTENLSAKVGEFGYLKAKDLESEVGKFGYLKADELEAEVGEFGYAKAKDLEATNLTVSNLSGDVASFKKATADNFTAVNADITEVSGDLADYKTVVAGQFSAKDAEIEALEAKDAEIENLVADNLEATNASIQSLQAEDARIAGLFAGYATIGDLNATNANIEALEADQAAFETATAENFSAVNASIGEIAADYITAAELEAESADIRSLFADYATVGQLDATNGNIDTLSSTVATINSAYMDEAKVNTLVAGKGYLTEAQVNTLVAGKGYFTEAQVNNLVVNKGYITTAQTNTLLSDYVKTSTLTADYIKASDIASTYATVKNLEATNATISNLGATYATIDLANVKAGSITQAMIGNGVVGTAQIADGSITDAKIVGLTANKITAGKLDAGVIEVVNLNAANITVGTINGQQIASGAIDTSKLTSSLSSTISTASTNASNALTNAANAKATADKSYEKITSKGEQLIVNGNGMMGDNTNFSSWTFDGAMGNNSPGSFTKAAGSSGTIYSDEYFLVSTNNTYTFELDAKSLLGTGTLYSFIMFYDVDKNQIGAPQHIYYPGSTTTLAKDLKKGDTVIYLSDASGWSTSFSYGFYLAIWNYTNSKGYTYPAETYTRNRVTLPKTSANKLDSSCINYTANTITLSTAYSGNTIPAGTPVSQGGDGGTYKYMPLSNTKVPTTWTRYSGKIGGVDYSGTNKPGMFPPGVAYARIGFLWNYSKTSGEQQWITNITVTDTTAVDKAQTTADGKNTVFYQTSAPSTSGRKTNDIWFDTDDGNKMYYWNGSAWTVRQFGTNAIANASITNALIADATIQNAKIANLDAAKITTGTLSADRIAASSIVADKIATGAITTDKLGANAVTAGKLAANAVTAGTIAADAITTEKIASGAVVADSIASDAITADKIVTNAVTADKIAASAVTANKILAGSITADKIAASAVTAGKISVGTLSAITANLGTVTAGVLQSENFAMSNYSVAEDGTVTGTVTAGLKIDLNNKAYYTPHITMKDNYIDLNGYMTIGKRGTGDIGEYSLAQGGNVVASGLYSHAEGYNTTASGQFSHAEGRYTTASGYESHAEGIDTKAEGNYGAHAEGYNTTASGQYSHAEGNDTTASGGGSHAEGRGTIASGTAQHVQGIYNIANSRYLHIVGNGLSDDSRSNAHTLSTGGNAWYAGDVIAGGTQATDGTVTGGVSLKSHTHAWDSITGKPTTFTPASHTHSYLPLAGGTLNTGASITLNMYGTRTLTLTGNSISADMSKETGGWAGNFASVKDPSGTTTTMLGWYGGASGLTHIFMGGTYSDPALKMTGAGQFTFKNTPYVGSTLVSLANHTHNYAGSSSAGGAATTALACTGNAATATKLATARTISLTGSVTGSGTFDGSGNLSITTTTNHSHTLDYRLQAAQSTATGSDANSATATGFHYINGTTNRPSFNQNNGVTGNDYRILTTAYSASWLQQIATDFRCDDIFYRRNQNGTWQAWRKLAFADEHLPLTGGTVSGNLILHADSGNSPKLIFERGDNTGSLTDWNIEVVSGNLIFNTVSASGSTASTQIAEMGYSGYLNVKELRENGTTLSSKYAANSHTHSYLPLSGGTITGTSSDTPLYVKSASTGSYIGFQNSGGTTLGYFGFSGANTPVAYIGGAKKLLHEGNWSTYCAPASHSHSNYLPLAGGTMTGPLTVNGGDGTAASKIILATGIGQITNSSTGTLFGYTAASTLAVGHSSAALNLRGSATRPTYNGSNIALSSDLSSYSLTSHSHPGLSDSGWITCTLCSGITAYSGHTPKIRKIGSVVYLVGKVLVTWNGSSATPLIVIPDGYEPIYHIHKAVQCGSHNMAKLWITNSTDNTNGNRVGVDYVASFYTDKNTTTQVWVDVTSTWLVD
jgi:hypothetical protein